LEETLAAEVEASEPEYWAEKQDYLVGGYIQTSFGGEEIEIFAPNYGVVYELSEGVVVEDESGNYSLIEMAGAQDLANGLYSLMPKDGWAL
jgi:hypothetical protein